MKNNYPLIQIGNNKPREMTETEYNEYLNHLTTQMPEPEPTSEERMEQIEAALIELAAMLGGA